MRSPNLLVALMLCLAVSGPLVAEVEIKLVSGFPFAPGEAANGASRADYLSSDARFLAITTVANNLENGIIDANHEDDVYVLDRQSGLFDLISRSAANPNRTADEGTSNFASAGAVSDDGRWVAFHSTADTLIESGTFVFTSSWQVHLFDRTTRTMELVSHAPGLAKAAGDRAALTAGMSLDGRFVLFDSASSNLAPGAGSNIRQVYLYDRSTGENTPVSRAAGAPGALGDENSDAIELSPDGRFVLFESSATNLVAGLSLVATPNVFVYDRVADTVELISRDAATATSAVGGRACDLTPDGRFVLLEAPGVQMQAGLVDGNGSASDTFVFDRQTGTAQLASHAASPSTTSGGGGSFGSSISDDGRYSYFYSFAANLVSPFVDGNGEATDVYLFDRQTSTIELVSHADGSPQQGGNGSSSSAGRQQMSADGRYLILRSTASNLAAGVSDSNGTADLFLFDRNTSSSILVSRVGNSLVAGSAVTTYLLEPDHSVVFRSAAALDPAAADPYTAYDIYRFDHASGSAMLLSATSQAGKATPISENLGPANLDRSGRRVTWGPYLWDGLKDSLQRICHVAGSPALPANENCVAGFVSPEGRFVVYSSPATDTVSGMSDTNGAYDTFLYDRNTSSALLLSHAGGFPNQTVSVAELDYGTFVSFMSDDARQFVLTSEAIDMVAGSTGAPSTFNLYSYDRPTQKAELITHSHSSTIERGNHHSSLVQNAADSSWAYYSSAALNLVAGFVDHNDHFDPESLGIVYVPDLYYFDRGTNQSTLVTRRPGTSNDGSEGVSYFAKATIDGSSIFYSSSGDDLVSGQVAQPGTDKLYRWNRATALNELVVHLPGNPLAPCNGSLRMGDMTSDGRFVLFDGTCQLVPGDLNAENDTYLLDRVSQEIVLISHLPGMPGISTGLATSARTISQDGRRITFWSDYSLYAYDLAKQQATLLSFAYYDGGEAVIADGKQASADGNRFLLGSSEAKMVPFDANSGGDIFLATLADLFADGFESGDTAAWSLTLP